MKSMSWKHSKKLINLFTASYAEPIDTIFFLSKFLYPLIITALKVSILSPSLMFHKNSSINNSFADGLSKFCIQTHCYKIIKIFIKNLWVLKSCWTLKDFSIPLIFHNLWFNRFLSNPSRFTTRIFL